MQKDLIKLKETIASNLVKLRKKHDWTIREASEHLKIKEKKLILMKNGYGLRNLNILYHVAHSYDTNIIDLLE